MRRRPRRRSEAAAAVLLFSTLCVGRSHYVAAFAPPMCTGMCHPVRRAAAMTRLHPVPIRRPHLSFVDSPLVMRASMSYDGELDHSPEEEVPPGVLDHSPEEEVPPGVPDETLYILDGTAILYRAFYSKTEVWGYDWERPLILMGMEIAQFLKDVEPRYIAVSFDYIGERNRNVRHALYPLYKANRPPRPRELMALMPLARELVTALGLRIFEADGYEADDVMATMAVWSTRRGLCSVLVTEDKDLFQSVTDSVFMMHPRTAELWGPTEVVRKCGVRPDQSRDLQALVGDPVDNIPGVRGVGKKTAVTLLKKYNCIDGIYDNVDDVASIQVYGAKRLPGKLLAQRDDVYLFREVTTLVDTVPMDGLRGLTAQDLRFRGVHYDAEEMIRAIGGFMGPVRYIKDNVLFDYY